MKKKTGLKGTMKVFSVDYNAIDTNVILDIHKCLTKKIYYDRIFGIIKKMFIVLLTNIVQASNHYVMK